MAPIRVLLLLVAVAAASAGKIPAAHHQLATASHGLTVDAHIHDLQREMATQITTLQTSRLSSSIIDKAIKKLHEIVSKIKERVSQLENELVDAAESISSKILSKINDFIKKYTGVDLDLVAKWEKFEGNAKKCTNTLKSQLRELLLQIRSDTLTCAAQQLTDIQQVGEQILDLSEILKVVPARTIKNIKACSAQPTPPPTEAPTEAPTDAAETTPEAETTVSADAAETTPEAETTGSADDAETTPEAETTGSADDAETTPEAEGTTPLIDDSTGDSEDSDESDESTDASVAVFKLGHGRVGSWSSKWKTAVCITKELTQGFKDLAVVPEIIYKLVQEIADVTSKESQQKLEECSEQSVAGKGEELQKLVAELAYCVIAPEQ